jgi:hypothetical protein
LAEDLLGRGSEEYLSLLTMVLSFVALGGIDPYVTAGINILGPHGTDLARPHPGEPLKLDD